jgi:hypothetical protein
MEQLISVLDNAQGIFPEVPKLPRTNIIRVLTARQQRIKAPNYWPLANRGSEERVIKTILSRTVSDLQLTPKALICGGLVIVKR